MSLEVLLENRPAFLRYLERKAGDSARRRQARDRAGRAAV
jgi:hypothetical protein